MRSVSTLMLVLTCVLGWLPPAAPAEGAEDGFAVWLEELRTDALSAGISQSILDAALADIEGPLTRVIDLDRKQPEFTQTLKDYVSGRVSDTRIAAGAGMMRRYPTWLGRVERQYGVQRRFILALWGIESNYGAHSGSSPVIPALLTLAHDGRRARYFRRELLDALHILDKGQIPLKSMVGSWAGAMGHCQFLPSSYRHYAVDADGDGRTDIWDSVPDVLASTANYLARAGWKDDQTWGRMVTLPQRFDSSLAGLKTRLPLSRWQALGVRRSNGNALPSRNLAASLILPDGPKGPAYLVYDNFRALLTWNRSLSFAVAVGTLSDRIAAE